MAMIEESSLNFIGQVVTQTIDLDVSEDFSDQLSDIDLVQMDKKASTQILTRIDNLFNDENLTLEDALLQSPAKNSRQAEDR